MKKILLLAAALACSGTYAQEPINLECSRNGTPFSKFRLIPDRNEVARRSETSTIYIAWSAGAVVIRTNIAGPFSTEIINRETLAYEYIDNLTDERSNGVCKLVETKNQI